MRTDLIGKKLYLRSPAPPRHGQALPRARPDGVQSTTLIVIELRYLLLHAHGRKLTIDAA